MGPNLTHTMNSPGALAPRNLHRPLPKPNGPGRDARLPFLEPWPEPSGNDLLLLNPRPDLTPPPEPAGRRSAFFDVLLG